MPLVLNEWLKMRNINGGTFKQKPQLSLAFKFYENL